RRNPDRQVPPALSHAPSPQPRPAPASAAVGYLDTPNVAICLRAPHPYAVHDGSSQTATAICIHREQCSPVHKRAPARTPGGTPHRRAQNSAMNATISTTVETLIRPSPADNEDFTFCAPLCPASLRVSNDRLERASVRRMAHAWRI